MIVAIKFFNRKNLILTLFLIATLFSSQQSTANSCADIFLNNKISFISLLSPDGRQTNVYGNANMLKKVDSTVLTAQQILKILGGQSSSEIRVITSLFGSVAQPKIMQGFSDVDMEALLVVQIPPGKAVSLNSPHSHQIKLLIQYFQNHIETVLQNNPDFIFIELKAGQFIDPADNEVHGIKWSLNEVRQGFKLVYETQGSRIVKLEEVFADNARIKADWAIPSIQAHAPNGAYQEASVIYRLGTQVGHSQPRLKPGFYGDSLPFRPTVIFFDESDTNIVQAASAGLFITPFEEVHRLFIKSLAKSPRPDLYKLLKRLYVLLQFWESPEFVGLALDKNFKHSQLESAVLNIITNPEALRLAQLKSQGLLFQILKQHELTAPKNSLTQWLASFGEVKDLDSILNELEEQLNKKINSLLETQSLVTSYLEVIKNRIPLSNEPLEAEPTFISLQPSSEWIENYEVNLIKWKQLYPHLDFTDPKNLHMTVYFLGLMTPPAIEKLKTLLPNILKTWKFTNGSIHLFGKEHDSAVILFDGNNPNISDLEVLRAQSVAIGARPTVDHLIFKPHITIAKIANSRLNLNLAEAKKEWETFITNETIFNLEEVEMSGIGIYKRNPFAKPGAPVYEKR